MSSPLQSSQQTLGTTAEVNASLSNDEMQARGDVKLEELIDLLSKSKELSQRLREEAGVILESEEWFQQEKENILELAADRLRQHQPRDHLSSQIKCNSVIAPEGSKIEPPKDRKGRLIMRRIVVRRKRSTSPNPGRDIKNDDVIKKDNEALLAFGLRNLKSSQHAFAESWIMHSHSRKIKRSLDLFVYCRGAEGTPQSVAISGLDWQDPVCMCEPHFFAVQPK